MMAIHPHSQAAQVGRIRKAPLLPLPSLRRSKHSAKNDMDPGGKYYRIEVRPKEEFDLFRVRDIDTDKSGHLECLLGRHKRSSRFIPVAWLVPKEDAHLSENGRLVIDRPGTRKVLKQIKVPIIHSEGDFFYAQPTQKRIQGSGRKDHKK